MVPGDILVDWCATAKHFFVDILSLKALRVLDRTWFPIKTTVLNIDTWTLGISIYIYICV